MKENTNESKTEFRWSESEISNRSLGLYELGDRVPSLARVARFWSNARREERRGS